MITKLTPMLYTVDLKETIDFYVTNLGFECKSFEPDWGWASLQVESVEIMLSQPNDHMPFDKPIFTGSFYFTPGDVDEIWNELKDKASIAYPIDDFAHGMREFAIYDNNGYMLQFGEEINP